MRQFGLLGMWVRSLLIGPLGFVVLFVLVYLLARWLTRRRSSACAPYITAGFWWIVGFALFLLAFCFPYPAYMLERPLVHWSRSLGRGSVTAQFGEAEDAGARRGAAVLVLGGGVFNHAMVNAESLSRIERGLDVWRSDPRRLFLFSEGGLDAEGVRWLEAYLRCRGVDGDRIEVESESRSTRQNLLYSTRILRDRDVDRVVLVTRERHVPRAYFAARNCGLRPSVAGAREETNLTFCPTWASLLYTSEVLNEYAGLIGYFVVGWL